MLRFAMLSLVCSVTAGVFGFGGGASSSWPGGPILFLVFLAFSAVGFLAGLTARPAKLQEARIDDRSPHERPTKDTHGT
jgi:uncharacterized membrane protein YtjA (UPF0391 family)